MSAPNGCTVHVVQKGDTLSAIGQRYKVNWNTLAVANHLKNPDMIHPGQKIIIPQAQNVVAAVEKDSTLLEEILDAASYVSNKAAFAQIGLHVLQQDWSSVKEDAVSWGALALFEKLWAVGSVAVRTVLGSIAFFLLSIDELH
jgi:LysM repeat protein